MSRTLAAAVAGLVASLLFTVDAHAYKRFPLKGRGGNITVEVAWGTWEHAGARFRAPELTVDRARSRIRAQRICVLRRLLRYGGGPYEPLSSWKLDWSHLSCGTGTQVLFHPFWIPRYFNAYHFDAVVTWQNPRSGRLIAKARVDWNEVSNYGCLNPGPYQNCRVGLYYGNVAAISFDF